MPYSTMAITTKRQPEFSLNITVYVSGLNVIEAGMTSDASRRVELIM